MVQTTQQGPRLPSGWLRRYPPLITFVLAVLIMFIAMPSALNQPQANPTTVLEYAPVPPDDDEPPPPQQDGSIGQLGLGSSNTLETEVARPPIEAPKPAGGALPQRLKCVD